MNLITDVDVHASKEYTVHIGKDLIDRTGALIFDTLSGTGKIKTAYGKKIAVISDSNVAPLYLADLQDPKTGKIPPRIVDINAGTAQNYYKYIAHYVTPEDYEAVKALGIADPSVYDFKKILEW